MKRTQLTLGKTPVLRKEPRRDCRSLRKHREIVVIGDVHGEYDGFVELLTHCGMSDAHGVWRGGRKTLIQMGDVIDRGARSLDVYTLLDRIQRAARREGGNVVRLVGNHEVELLKGNGQLTSLPRAQAAAFTVSLRRDIFSGKITAAYAQQGYLFTHAGLTGDLQLALSPHGEGEDAASMANVINAVLVNAAESGDYSHPIFNVGSTRGGQHRFGGVFWEDIEDLFYSDNPLDLKQVVGHTPLREISVSEDGNIIAVDVGLFEGYGGGRGYLRIKSGRPSIINLRTAQ
ncbi:MAG: metallophosphoesterase [Elusimicrobiaceae bacterium]|jgi:hypothetical protein